MRFVSEVDGWLIPLFIIARAGMPTAIVAVLVDCGKVPCVRYSRNSEMRL